MSDLKNRILKKARGGRRKHVKQWDETVLLCGLPTKMRLRISKERKEGTFDPEALSREALRRGLRDPDTAEPIYTDTEIEQLLEEDTQGVCDELLADILELTGVDKKAIEEAKKRFLENPNGDSSTSLPTDSEDPSENSCPDDQDPSPVES